MNKPPEFDLSPPPPKCPDCGTVLNNGWCPTCASKRRTTWLVMLALVVPCFGVGSCLGMSLDPKVSESGRGLANFLGAIGFSGPILALIYRVLYQREDEDRGK